MKVASSTQSSKDSTLYITMSPCKECSKLIFQSGIKRLVYNIEYKDKTGLDFLKQSGLEITHIKKLEV
jgi:dCMP deaminase